MKVSHEVEFKILKIRIEVSTDHVVDSTDSFEQFRRKRLVADWAWTKLFWIDVFGFVHGSISFRFSAEIPFRTLAELVHSRQDLIAKWHLFLAYLKTMSSSDWGVND